MSCKVLQLSVCYRHFRWNTSSPTKLARWHGTSWSSASVLWPALCMGECVCVSWLRISIDLFYTRYSKKQVVWLILVLRDWIIIWEVTWEPEVSHIIHVPCHLPCWVLNPDRIIERRVLTFRSLNNWTVEYRITSEILHHCVDMAWTVSLLTLFFFYFSNHDESDGSFNDPMILENTRNHVRLLSLSVSCHFKRINLVDLYMFISEEG